MTSSLAPLLTSPGWDLLDAWERRPERRETDPLVLGDALRKAGVDPALASAVLSQLALRDAAENKFGPLARRMIFTRDGLEQASRLVVAVRHAHRMHTAGVTYVADLGCGIGTESLAAAGLGMRTLSVDLDEDAAAATSANLRDLPECDVLCGNIMDLDMRDLLARGVDAIFADPARRTGTRRGSKRINDPEAWSPPLSTVLSWSSHIPAVGVKVAPGIDHSLLHGDLHAQWTSVDGALVEAALWTAPLAPEGPGRSAQVIHGERAYVLYDEDTSSPHAPVRLGPTGPLAARIAEPDDAVIRAGLVARLAEDSGTHLIDSRIAYLTGSQIAPSPFLHVFDVLDVTALRPKAISAALRPLKVGHVEVKKRGADVDPQMLRSRIRHALDPESPDGVVVFATRVAGQHRAIIGRRVRPEGNAAHTQ